MSESAAAGGFIIGGLLAAIGFGLVSGTVGSVVGVIGIVAVIGLGSYRYGYLDTSRTGIIASTAGLAILIVSANQLLFGAENSQEQLLLFLGVLGGGLVIIGVVVWFGFDREEIVQKTYTGVMGAFLGVLGVFAVVVWSEVLFVVVGWFWRSDVELGGLVVSTLAVGLGTVSVAGLFLRGSGQSLAFIDIEWPAVRDSVIVILGVAGLVVLNVVINLILEEGGFESARHSVIIAGETSPELLLVLLPLSVLVVGPGEELLYRNVIQKSLYGSFSKPAAVVIASVIFSGVHYFAYAIGNTPLEVLATLVIVFSLSVVLGGVYAWTENIVVPGLIHGGFNAVVFLALYVRVTAMII